MCVMRWNDLRVRDRSAPTRLTELAEVLFRGGVGLGGNPKSSKYVGVRLYKDAYNNVETLFHVTT